MTKIFILCKTVEKIITVEKLHSQLFVGTEAILNRAYLTHRLVPRFSTAHSSNCEDHDSQDHVANWKENLKK